MSGRSVRSNGSAASSVATGKSNRSKKDIPPILDRKLKEHRGAIFQRTKPQGRQLVCLQPVVGRSVCQVAFTGVPISQGSPQSGITSGPPAPLMTSCPSNEATLQSFVSLVKTMKDEMALLHQRQEQEMAMLLQRQERAEIDHLHLVQNIADNAQPPRGRSRSQRRNGINVETVYSDEEADHARYGRSKSTHRRSEGEDDDEIPDLADQNIALSEDDAEDDSDDDATVATMQTFQNPAPNKRRSRKLFKSSPKALMKAFYSYREAEKWVKKHHTSPSRGSSSEDDSSSESDGSGPSIAEGTHKHDPKSKEPSMPPVGVHGRDKSIKKKDELFVIALRTCGASELKAKLVPPTLSKRHHDDLCETMIDAVSLPGKTQNVDSENALQAPSASMETMASGKRQQLRGEEMPRDLKWKQESRATLKAVIDGHRGAEKRAAAKAGVIQKTHGGARLKKPDGFYSGKFWHPNEKERQSRPSFWAQKRSGRSGPAGEWRSRFSGVPRV